MTDLSQEDFLKAKAALDKCIKLAGKLADQAAGAMRDCCHKDADPDTLDNRDKFAAMAGHLLSAQGEMMKARAIGGSIQGDGVTRSGDT
jgi:hypothetical protein